MRTPHEILETSKYHSQMNARAGADEVRPDPALCVINSRLCAIIDRLNESIVGIGETCDRLIGQSAECAADIVAIKHAHAGIIGEIDDRLDTLGRRLGELAALRSRLETVA